MNVKTVFRPDPGTWYELPGLVPPLGALCLTREFKKSGTKFTMCVYKQDAQGAPHFYHYLSNDKQGPIAPPSAWMVSSFEGISKKAGDFHDD